MRNIINATNKHRRLILEAALMSVAENKISGTSMRDIAGRAGISHGTLHYHYPSKAELLRALLDEIDRIFNEDRSDKLARLQLNPTVALREFLEQEKRLLSQQRHVVEAFIDFWGHGHTDAAILSGVQTMYRKWRRDIELVVTDGVKRGEFDPDVAPLVPGIMVSLMEGATLQRLIDEEAFDLEAYFNQGYEMIIQMLVNLPPTREPYPTDLKNDQWALVASLLPPPRKSAGRPRRVDLREVVNAILYLIQTGCSWRMLPHDFPHWKTVYGYHNQWNRDGTLVRISAQLGVDLNHSSFEKPGGDEID